ncbi:hypothetical protein N7G274_003138 [Stereocaulon virgatum]|uniref:Zn(2)-C6 fungal-type domain-containing protein n=1 Tax=Stereocaulon virgatum TaxID=373712 RepID=A0ABR4AH73_9LECA
MSAESPSISFFPTSKRSACDRCRKQKLRCPPRENATQSCVRCVRASLPCTTGYIKPLGRSGGDGVTTFSHGDAEPAAIFNIGMSEGPLSLMDITPLDSQSSPSTGITFESTNSWIVPDVFNDNQSLTQVWSRNPTQDMASSNFPGSYAHESLLSENVLLPDVRLSTNGNTNGTLSSGLDHLPSAPTPSKLILGEQMPHADSIIMQRQQMLIGSGENIPSRAECDIRLSQLSLDLSKQMQELVTKSQQGITAGKDNNPSETPFEVTSKGSADACTSNAFGDALRSTSEFLAILLCYDSGVFGETSSATSMSQRSGVSNDVSRSSVSFAIVLRLLSSYLRIIAIFDDLFHQLYELQCRSGATSPWLLTGLQTLPDLHLAGFPVQQGSLQTKILIQAIQHQFELTEKILGLPVELRVSDRQEVYHIGLLQNDGAKPLLQAILDGQHGGGGADVFTLDRIRAIDSLESLKENIMKVQQFLLQLI